MTFRKRHKAPVLAALARFAKNFNQEQVYVRDGAQPGTDAGHEYGDGSYNTLAYKVALKRQLSRAEVENVVKQSGCTA